LDAQELNSVAIAGFDVRISGATESTTGVSGLVTAKDMGRESVPVWSSPKRWGFDSNQMGPYSEAY